MGEDREVLIEWRRVDLAKLGWLQGCSWRGAVWVLSPSKPAACPS